MVQTTNDGGLNHVGEGGEDINVGDFRVYNMQQGGPARLIMLAFATSVAAAGSNLITSGGYARFFPK